MAWSARHLEMRASVRPPLARRRARCVGVKEKRTVSEPEKKAESAKRIGRRSAAKIIWLP